MNRKIEGLRTSEPDAPAREQATSLAGASGSIGNANVNRCRITTLPGAIRDSYFCHPTSLHNAEKLRGM